MSPKIVRVSWLIGRRMLSEVSPVALLCKEVGVRWLLLWDGYVYGPSPGFTETLDLLIEMLKPRSFLDLFCGSGAFSKLAYRRGVRRITCVDRFAEAARRNLRGLGVEVVEADALSYRPGDRFDLVAADPPEELIDEVLGRLHLIRRITGRAAVLWLGPYHRSGKRVRSLQVEGWSG